MSRIPSKLPNQVNFLASFCLSFWRKLDGMVDLSNSTNTFLMSAFRLIQNLVPWVLFVTTNSGDFEPLSYYFLVLFEPWMDEETKSIVGFELWTSGVERDRSANCAVTNPSFFYPKRCSSTRSATGCRSRPSTSWAASSAVPDASRSSEARR